MDLHAMLDDYLAVRRALGTKLAREEKLLRQFLAWLDGHGRTAITADAALEWARQPGDVSAGWLGMRMRAVRGFAGFCRSMDGITEVPPPGVLTGSGQRATPYLYSQADIDALCAAAGTLRRDVRRATYRTLIRLLAVTGMRISEAASLDASDFDAAAGILTVREAKNGRTPPPAPPAPRRPRPPPPPPPPAPRAAARAGAGAPAPGRGGGGRGARGGGPR